jgi:hypothetical protein
VPELVAAHCDVSVTVTLKLLLVVAACAPGINTARAVTAAKAAVRRTRDVNVISETFLMAQLLCSLILASGRPIRVDQGQRQKGIEPPALRQML